LLWSLLSYAYQPLRGPCLLAPALVRVYYGHKAELCSEVHWKRRLQHPEIPGATKYDAATRVQNGAIPLDLGAGLAFEQIGLLEEESQTRQKVPSDMLEMYEILYNLEEVVLIGTL
jgi:hypothetical protein